MKIMGKNLNGSVDYSRKDVIQSILDDSATQEVLQEISTKKNQSISQTRSKAQEILEELTSAYNKKALSISYWIVKAMQKSMFEEISMYGDHMAEIRKLASEGKIIFFVPNHKSHLDYLLISYILFRHDLAPPHIAAGVNLSFWPMGTIFRNTGAYFIRRKISGNFLYTKLLEFYFRWMVRNRIFQEFYMEGGRSRDGKIREAQSGIFTLLIEQVFALGLENEVYIVPTTVTYDKIPEMSGLLRELRGESKVKESTLSLVSSLSLVFKKHGRVHFCFGKPRQILSGLNEDENPKKKIQNLSAHLFSNIQRNKVVTSPGLLATVLLTGKAATPQEIQQTMMGLIEILAFHGHYLSKDLSQLQKNWDSILHRYESERWFVQDQGMVQVQSGKRMEMNYYKNDTFPFLVPFLLQSLSKQLEPADFGFIREIIVHEYPYADAQSQEFPPHLEDFFKTVGKPIFRLYGAVLGVAKSMSISNLSSTDSQNQIKASLERSHFPFPEMATTEAVRSACMFFHQLTPAQAILEKYSEIFARMKNE